MTSTRSPEPVTACSRCTDAAANRSQRGPLGPACARADVHGQDGRHECDEQRGGNHVPRNPPMDHERNDPDADGSPQENGKTCLASVDPARVVTTVR